jgi:nicotinate phosphoribosyltransferase
MEINGKPHAKRSKWSGSKRVLRCRKCCSSLIAPNNKKKHKCSCGGTYSDLLVPFTENNKIYQKILPAKDIRSFVLKQTKQLEL